MVWPALLWLGRHVRLRLPLVLDVRVVSVLVRVVGHDLDPPVGQGHAVLALGLAGLLHLVVGVVVAGLAVADGVAESVALLKR